MKTNVLRMEYEIFNRASTSILRGVCMILIMLHHCYQQGIHYDISFNRVVSCVLKDAGFLCTGVFFLLSGYGLYLSMKQRSFVLSRNYIINRFIKLFVPYGWYFFVAWGLALGGGHFLIQHHCMMCLIFYCFQLLRESLFGFLSS